MTDHPSADPTADVAALRAEVEHLRARSAEAAALRGELLTLRAERQEQLERLQRQVARLAGAATSAQAKEVRQLRAQLEKARAGETRARRRAERLRERVRALEASRSHRAARSVRRVLEAVRPGRQPRPADVPTQRRRSKAAARSATPPTVPAPDTTTSTEAPEHSTPVMLDCRSTPRDDLAWALDEVGGLAGVAALDVVVLIDSVDFDLPRSRGHLVEYVPPVEQVADRVGADAAARLEDSRWQQLVESHRPREIYRVAEGEDGPRLDLLMARPGTAST